MKKLVAALLSIILVFGLCSSLFVSAAETTYYLKPADFKDNLGTWTIVPVEADSFFEILKAPGGNQPASAKPAVVTVDIPTAGEYYIWAYTRDYVGGVGAEGKPLSSSNRNFQLNVNGKLLEKVFGTHATNGWAWEAGGPVQLTAGNNVIQLIDTVNYYGRCQAIAITTDKNFKGATTQADLKTAFEKNAAKVVATSGGTSTATTAPTASTAPALTPTDLAKDAKCMILLPDNFSQLGVWQVREDNGAYENKVLLGFETAPGKEKPKEVDPAIASVAIPEDGTYFVWGRSKDFASNNPGTRVAQVQLGDKLFSAKLGAHLQDGYAWTLVGSAEYKKGNALLGLLDVSPGYPRVDMLIITNDAKFVPSNDVAQLKTMVTTYGLKADATKTSETKLPQATTVGGDVKPTASPTPTPTAKPTPTPTAKPTATPTPTPKPFQIPAGIPTQKDRPADEIAVKLNDVYLVFKDDSKPFTENDRTLVPFRAIFEAFGCEIGWDEATQVASGKKEGVTVELTIGKTDAKVNGKVQPLPDGVVANTYNDRTFVPLRFIANALGAEVGWDEKTSTVLITMK